MFFAAYIMPIQTPYPAACLGQHQSSAVQTETNPKALAQAKLQNTEVLHLKLIFIYDATFPKSCSGECSKFRKKKGPNLKW